jgi:hypothetical protein
MYYAQDASVIKNTAEIYSSSDFGGTANLIQWQVLWEL